MKKRSKSTQSDSPITDTRCEFILSGNCTRQQQMITDTPKRLFNERLTKIQLLHDLKKIAIAINELVRDLDRIERDTRSDN